MTERKDDQVKNFIDDLIVKQQVKFLELRLPPISNPQLSNSMNVITSITTPLIVKMAANLAKDGSYPMVISGVENLVVNSTFHFHPIARLFNQINGK